METDTRRRSKRLAAQTQQHQLEDLKQQKLDPEITGTSAVNDTSSSSREDSKPIERGGIRNGGVEQPREEVTRQTKGKKCVRVKIEDPAETEYSPDALVNSGGVHTQNIGNREAAPVIKEESSTQASNSDIDEMAGFIAKGGKFIGAHTSAAGGVWNAVTDAVAIKGRAFALFLKSQRQWKAKPLEEEVVTKFKAAMKECGYHPDYVLPHGSYLLNCGSPNPETLQKSRDALLDEIERCQRLGLNRYNFHPGSTCGEMTVDQCLDRIGESINQVLRQTSGVTLVVENMSCQGNTVGGRFEELRGIIDRVEDKSRIGVCLDTCHAFAAGYDLSTEAGYNKMTDEFERVIGFKYLKGVHLNDSKGKVGCHLDRHENIGKGFIGLKGFKRLMNDERFEHIPMILETPPGADYGKEINLLYSLVDR